MVDIKLLFSDLKQLFKKHFSEHEDEKTTTEEMLVKSIKVFSAQQRRMEAVRADLVHAAFQVKDSGTILKELDNFVLEGKPAAVAAMEENVDLMMYR